LFALRGDTCNPSYFRGLAGYAHILDRK
jgi:hypothetical protein